MKTTLEYAHVAGQLLDAKLGTDLGPVRELFAECRAETLDHARTLIKEQIDEARSNEAEAERDGNPDSRKRWQFVRRMLTQLDCDLHVLAAPSD